MTNAPSRRSVLRGLGIAAVGTPLAVWVAGCGSDSSAAGGQTGAAPEGNTLERAREQGFVRVGIANEPPYTRVDPDGTVTGVEPDVLRAVCKRLGIEEIEGVITPYESMIPGLKAGRWDVVAAGLFMKQSRCAEVSYSHPVIVSTESFAVPPGNPKDITSVQDVLDNPDLRIAVLPGGFEEGILNEAGVPSSQHVTVNDGHSGIEAVKAGRSDAFFLPTLSLNSLREDVDGFDVTPPVEDAPVTGSGAAFRKEDTELFEAYNEELAAFKETQEYKDILTQWGFDPESVEGVTTEELCATEG